MSKPTVTLGYRFYATQLGIPLVIALMTFLLFDLGHLDLAFSNLFWDTGAGQFLLEHNRLFEKITHKWARLLPDWTGEGAVLMFMLSFAWPPLNRIRALNLMRFAEAAGLASGLRFAYRYRLDALFVVVAFAASTGAVHFLKSHTGVYCPVETTLYGGGQPRLAWLSNFSLWSSPDGGRCWPGGHASSAFSLFALYFVARRYRWWYSTLLLELVIALGMLYGTARVLQGWHYMSHTLWAGVTVWLVTLTVALAFYSRAELQRPLIAPIDKAKRPLAVG